MLYLKQLCLLFAAILFFLQPANALLRYRSKQQVVRAAYQPAREQVQRSRHILSRLSYLHLQQLHRNRPGVNPDDRYSETTDGVLAFTCTLLGFVCFAALGITSAPFFVAPAIIFATLAVILGSVGIRRYKQGYAIFGLALGVLELLGAFIALALL